MDIRIAHAMPAQFLTCPDCHGDGHYTVTTRQHHSGEQEIECARCEGTGNVVNPECDGDEVME